MRLSTDFVTIVRVKTANQWFGLKRDLTIWNHHELATNLFTTERRKFEFKENDYVSTGKYLIEF